jgi:hypothetical protein
MTRVAAVAPVILLMLFTGLLWLLGLVCGADRRRYVTDLSQQAMERSEADRSQLVLRRCARPGHVRANPATCRTPWATPPCGPPAAMTAAAATWTAPPAACSPGTSAGLLSRAGGQDPIRSLLS